MIVSLIGHLGYVGQNIKDALQNSDIENMYLLDRETTHKDMINYISKSNVFIHCAAIQRPKVNVVESFLPNFELTKKIVDNLPETTKLIFISSIHYRSETPFGIVRRMEEDYIKKNVKSYTIYHLPYTYGAHGKPNYNNVFNTYIINVIKNEEIKINEFSNEFPIISINYFTEMMIINLNESLNVVDNFNTKNTTLPDFVSNLSKIKRGLKLDSNFLKELKSVYEWYRNQ